MTWTELQQLLEQQANAPAPAQNEPVEEYE